MTNYYNENDPYAAQWLRNLIEAGHIPKGHVDERSIVDVRPDDLAGFVQCHFFAGIAGWSLALRLAGWPEEREVWTGSCPCQPLSGAGQRKGHADERHLWPAFHHLIAECRPATVFGEQVASKDGREWLAGIRADLEAVGYACGAADLCAAGVGAPHARHRLYWLANSERAERRALRGSRRDEGTDSVSQGQESSVRHGGGRQISEAQAVANTYGGNAGAEGLQRSREHGQRPQDSCRSERMGDAESAGLQGQWSEYRPSGERHSGLVGFAVQIGVPQWNGPTVAIDCADGSRRVSAQPNAFPLAHGVPGRMGKLRGAGNAIVPQVAAEVIASFMEAA